MNLVIERVWLCGHWYHLEYEGLQLLCSQCGFYGHLGRNCPIVQTIIAMGQLIPVEIGQPCLWCQIHDVEIEVKVEKVQETQIMKQSPTSECMVNLGGTLIDMGQH